MTHTNIDGRLLLVSGQNPDLDVGFHECCYGFWDTRLQSVFYRSGSQQQQVLCVAKRWKTEREEALQIKMVTSPQSWIEQY